MLTHGAYNYWKSHNFTALEDELLDVAVRYAEGLPSPQSEIFFAALGGATTRPAVDSTAYPHRHARFAMNFHGRWEDPAAGPQCIGWAREFFAATAPFAASGVYVNFMTADEKERVASAYGSNYARLAAVKRKYDPTNLFRVNQNITPS